MDVFVPSPATLKPGPRISRPLFEILCSLLEGADVFIGGIVTLILMRVLRGGTISDQDLSQVLLCVLVAVSYVLLVWLLGAYPRSRPLADRAENGAVDRILAAIFVCFALFSSAFGDAGFRIAWSASWFAVALGALRLTSPLHAALAPRIVSRRSLVCQVVIVGSSPTASQLVDIVRRSSSQDIELLGFFDDRRTRLGSLEENLPYLGNVDALIEFSTDHDDIHVCMTLPWTAGVRISSLLERLRFLPITVWLVPDAELLALFLHRSMTFNGVLMPTLMTPPFSFWGRLVKTTFDYAVGLVILLLIAPFLLGVALLIKLDSAGPVLFRQQRSGQFGRKFNIYKFRSLYEDDPEATLLVSKGDPRVTRVGRYIRKFSIDELPQIFNVLRGEMSLVGPRPHAPKAKANGRLYADVMPSYALRYRAKPGMTGWAQINGWRGETDTEEKLRKRVEFDLYYISNWSVWLDLKILCRTGSAMIFPKNNV